MRDTVDFTPSSSNRLMNYRAVSSDDAAARVSAAEELVYNPCEREAVSPFGGSLASDYTSSTHFAA